MDMQNLTKSDVIEALRKVVTEKGEAYVYPESEKRVFDASDEPTCSYIVERDGEMVPSCIAGHVLVNEFGMPVDDLVIHEGTSALVPLVEMIFEDESDEFDRIDFDDPRYEAIFTLVKAQRTQDNGFTWGEALTAAITGEVPVKSDTL